MAMTIIMTKHNRDSEGGDGKYDDGGDNVEDDDDFDGDHDDHGDGDGNLDGYGVGNRRTYDDGNGHGEGCVRAYQGDGDCERDDREVAMRMAMAVCVRNRRCICKWACSWSSKKDGMRNVTDDR